jgi:putative endopeptidase
MKRLALFIASIYLFNSCKVKIPTVEAINTVAYGENTRSNEQLSTIDVNYMGKGIKPSDDFFLFASGQWVANNPVPPSESRWGSFNELEKSNMQKLTAILSYCSSESADLTEDQKMLGAYYRSFVDMETRNRLGIEVIREDLDKVKNAQSKSDITAILAEHHSLGIRSLFSFGVRQDLKQVDAHICYLSQGGIGLPNKDYYLDEKKKDILTKYEEHIVKVMNLLGEEKQQSIKIAKDVLGFETKLAEAMMSPAEQRIPEKTYNKMGREEVIEKMGKIDFDIYLSSIGSYSFDSMIVSQPVFVERIAEMISEVPMDQWKSYLLWKVTNHFAGHLNQEMVEANFSFYGSVLSGKSEMKPINERAIDEITSKDFGEMLGKEFVSKHYSSLAQNRVNEMVDNLLLVFRERIQQLEWMSETTKQEALGKLNAIGRKLGFPSKWEDYSDLFFLPNQYINNIKAEDRNSFQKNLKELLEPVDKNRWGMPAHMVNAYYHPLLNEIAFPAGIMQPPFFDENAEDAVNYGRIGMVIGHEFTHGFDDMGSKFAADGTFRNWWTENDRAAFESKTKTLGETYSAFCPIEGHCVNPSLTMGENIADLGGLTLAYHAYTKTKEFNSSGSRQGFTPAQRFFIAYAQLWKINYTDQEMKNRIANDPHSPGMFRVNGPLKNCLEFFEAFSIPEGSAMRNPPSKLAKIW